ncbi:ME6 [Scenedesmus sp. PABB004]|nr:ME6 [Scenedesmus sp. PABB004]
MEAVLVADAPTAAPAPARADAPAAKERASGVIDISASSCGGASAAGAAAADAALARLRATAGGLERYVLLRRLQAAGPRAFYAALLRHTEELLPYIYTPTVGEACQKYHTLPIATQARRLCGERPLGDLGANGMGISEGKIQLYTAAAGIDPAVCLPICLDVGTDNAALRGDPRYRGCARRARAAPTTTRLLLARHGASCCSFNDDIQGTACITLAGVLSALRATGRPRLDEQRVLFLGAGEAGTGIGELVAAAMVKAAARRGEALSLADARARCHFMDSRGLICAERADAAALPAHKRPWAHAGAGGPLGPDLLAAVRALRPSVLIGVSTAGGAFTREVVEEMASINVRPLIFPLSNPTHLSECTFADAVAWSGGRALFASGSPFDPVVVGGQERHPAQANNAYVFPAIGAAAVLTRAAAVPGDAFLVAAEALAGMTSAGDAARGELFPPFSAIRGVSVRLTAAVAAHLIAAGAGTPPPGFDGDWEAAASAAILGIALEGQRAWSPSPAAAAAGDAAAAREWCRCAPEQAGGPSSGACSAVAAMGKLSKLVAKAEALATEQLGKLLEPQQQQQPGGSQQAYAPPTVYAQQQQAPPRPFSTPPPSPRPYAAAGAPQQAAAGQRPSTPPPPGAPAYLAPTSYTPAPPPRSAARRKKAVLIACCYPGTSAALRGPANDVSCMHYLLTSKLGFDPANIVTLRDDDTRRGIAFVPVRDSIMRALGWLVSDLRQGDSLFVHFSGHGSQQRDPTGEEEDGYDETILPTDFKRAGQITDTALARALVHGLPTGVTLHALFDSCHSGTMLDLPYETKFSKGQAFWRRNNMRGSAGGLVVQLGACDDHQTAADTAKLSATAYTGAATYTFIQSIERYGSGQSYGALLQHMTETLRSLGKSSVGNTSGTMSAVAAGLPLVMGVALGPLGLVAGAQLSALAGLRRMSEQLPVMSAAPGPAARPREGGARAMVLGGGPGGGGPPTDATPRNGVYKDSKRARSDQSTVTFASSKQEAPPSDRWYSSTARALSRSLSRQFTFEEALPAEPAAGDAGGGGGGSLGGGRRRAALAGGAALLLLAAAAGAALLRRPAAPLSRGAGGAGSYLLGIAAWHSAASQLRAPPGMELQAALSACEARVRLPEIQVSDGTRGGGTADDDSLAGLELDCAADPGACGDVAARSNAYDSAPDGGDAAALGAADAAAAAEAAAYLAALTAPGGWDALTGHGQAAAAAAPAFTGADAAAALAATNAYEGGEPRWAATRAAEEAAPQWLDASALDLDGCAGAADEDGELARECERSRATNRYEAADPAAQEQLPASPGAQRVRVEALPTGLRVVGYDAAAVPWGWAGPGAGQAPAPDVADAAKATHLRLLERLQRIAAQRRVAGYDVPAVADGAARAASSSGAPEPEPQQAPGLLAAAPRAGGPLAAPPPPPARAYFKCACNHPDARVQFKGEPLLRAVHYKNPANAPIYLLGQQAAPQQQQQGAGGAAPALPARHGAWVRGAAAALAACVACAAGTWFLLARGYHAGGGGGPEAEAADGAAAAARRGDGALAALVERVHLHRRPSTLLVPGDSCELPAPQLGHLISSPFGALPAWAEEEAAATPGCCAACGRDGAACACGDARPSAAAGPGRGAGGVAAAAAREALLLGGLAQRCASLADAPTGRIDSPRGARRTTPTPKRAEE